MEEEEEHGWIMYIDTCINDNYRLVCYNTFCSISLRVMLSLLSIKITALCLPDQYGQLNYASYACM